MWDYLEAVKLNYEYSALQETIHHMSAQINKPLIMVAPSELCDCDHATAIIRAEILEWCDEHVDVSITQEIVEREYHANEIWGVTLYYTFFLPVIHFGSEADRLAFYLRWVVPAL